MWNRSTHYSIESVRSHHYVYKGILLTNQRNILSYMYISEELKKEVEKWMITKKKLNKIYIIQSKEKYDSKIQEYSLYVTVFHLQYS